ncbi:glycosyltransferase [Humibacter albus]|uniref:glycosyltransferase n=1 Tax=Humibacter albus TaxID=427754 RepID=UPI0003B40226|nr:glycosyltransferase [Humibacter albus]
MKILIWHVHGGWMDSFVRGPHEYLLPTTAERDGWGLGRGGRSWPANAREVSPGALRDEQPDVVILQRPEEIAETERMLRSVPGRDLPALFLEHNTPREHAATSLHPLASQRDIPIVHVTHFNELFWDNGEAPTTVIEHGIVDPGLRYTGELEALAAVINEPVRRARVTGTDLLSSFTRTADVHVFGMGTDELPSAVDDPGVVPCGDLPTEKLHAQLARRRAYLHPVRWTSLGLSLLEAMFLGMPVLALATTEAVRAVPPGTGVVSTDLDELRAAAARLIADPDHARELGLAARDHVMQAYSLPAFLSRWDTVLEDAVADWRSRHRARRPRPTPTAAPAAHAI